MFSIENIKDAQEILRIKNKTRQTISDPNISPRVSVKPDFEEMRFEKREHLHPALKQYGPQSNTSALTVRKVKPAEPTTPPASLLRKRSINVVEEIEKNYTNIKLRKVENAPAKDQTPTVAHVQKTPTRLVQLPNATLARKTSTTTQAKQVIVIQESPAKKTPKTVQQVVVKQEKKSPASEAENRRFMCVKCTQKFDNRDDHMKHVCKPPPKTPVCFCGRKFQSFDELSNHVKSDHNKSEGKTQQKSSVQASPTVNKKIYACKNCKVKFNELSIAQKHSQHCKTSKAVES